MVTNQEDRQALSRIIKSVFSIEADHREELQAILHDDTISVEDRADKYINTIIDHLAPIE